jgi:hypothetical protein
MFRARKRIPTVARTESRNLAPLKYLFKTKRLSDNAWCAESVNLIFVMKYENDTEYFYASGVTKGCEFYSYALEFIGIHNGKENSIQEKHTQT